MTRNFPDMIQISSSCVNKMVPETRLALKLLSEHVHKWFVSRAQVVCK